MSTKFYLLFFLVTTASVLAGCTTRLPPAESVQAQAVIVESAAAAMRRIQGAGRGALDCSGQGYQGGEQSSFEAGIAAHNRGASAFAYGHTLQTCTRGTPAPAYRPPHYPHYDYRRVW